MTGERRFPTRAALESQYDAARKLPHDLYIYVCILYYKMMQ